MKKAILTLLQSIFVINAYSQNVEYSLQVHSGLFSFGGSSATENSFILRSDVPNENYTNNPYGSKNALSYGVSGQVQKITIGKLVYGIELSYEILRSKVNIDRIDGETLTGDLRPASGQTILTHNFISAYPNLGYRFSLNDLDFDLTFGAELGHCLGAYEKGEATPEDNSGRIKTDHEINDPGFDFRLRPSLTGYYKRYGLSVGYAHGITNYTNDLDGANRERYARFIRFGLVYKFQ